MRITRSTLPRTAAWLGRTLPLLTLLVIASCVSDEREREMGELLAVDVNAQLPMVHDPVLNAYVSSLGGMLARLSDRPDVDYRFYVINSTTVNAFALPGGHIYLTRGLIEQTRSGSELAAALAHEIGHVAGRHGVAKMERELRTGSLVSELYHMILGGEPALPDAIELAGELWSASNSREDEKEADTRAVQLLSRAGIDPGSMVSLLRTLEAFDEGTSGQMSGWFASHPLTSERIAEAESEIIELPTTPGSESQETLALLPEYLRRYPVFMERLVELPDPPLLP